MKQPSTAARLTQIVAPLGRLIWVWMSPRGLQLPERIAGDGAYYSIDSIVSTAPSGSLID